MRSVLSVQGSKLAMRLSRAVSQRKSRNQTDQSLGKPSDLIVFYERRQGSMRQNECEKMQKNVGMAGHGMAWHGVTKNIAVGGPFYW